MFFESRWLCIRLWSLSITLLANAFVWAFYNFLSSFLLTIKTKFFLKAKLAYADSIAKPPRNILRAQAKYGTAMRINSEPSVSNCSSAATVKKNLIPSRMSIPKNSITATAVDPERKKPSVKHAKKRKLILIYQLATRPNAVCGTDAVLSLVNLSLFATEYCLLPFQRIWHFLAIFGDSCTPKKIDYKSKEFGKISISKPATPLWRLTLKIAEAFYSSIFFGALTAGKGFHGV